MSTSSTAPPAACRAARYDPSLATVSGSRYPPPDAADPLDRVDVLARVHRSQVSDVHLGGLDPLVAEPVARATAPARSPRSAPPARDASRCRARAELGCFSRTDAIASTVPVALRSTRATPPGRGRRRRCGRALHGPVRRPPRRERDADLRAAAGRLLQLVGAGRAGRGDVGGRQPRAPSPGHDRRRARRGSRVRRACPVRRGAGGGRGPDPAGRALRRRPPRPPVARPGGRSQRPADRARRRRGYRPPPGPPAQRAGRRGSERSRCSRAVARSR